MNRREKRKLKKKINIFVDVVRIIKQYFPQLTDTRHQSYVDNIYYYQRYYKFVVFYFYLFYLLKEYFLAFHTYLSLLLFLY